MADTVLTHLTDTMLVKEFVRTADTTAKACRDDLPSSCAERHRLDALEIAQWKAKAQALPPSDRANTGGWERRSAPASGTTATPSAPACSP
jgi:hypothetical protein